MNIEKGNLNQELRNLLDFWNSKMLSGTSISGEISINETINNSSDLGSMYLSRVMYGASAACMLFNTNEYEPLASKAFQLLESEFKNPDGGYIWAKNSKGENIHDIDNNNLGQAFVLYGLAEYYSYTKSVEVKNTLEKHTKFIVNTIKDVQHGGYLDGFTENWQAGDKQNKALGTHIHLLEALTKVYENIASNDLIILIEDLITIVIDKFIENDTLNCLHRTETDWAPLPNEIWAGHNTEVSWILCKSAKAINNKTLIAKCNGLALDITNKAIEQAYDYKNGGLFNVLENNKPTELVKIWWPQAETVIALLNCYEICDDTKYLNLAHELSSYISNNFIAKNGEWYTEISNNSEPISSTPLVHFWKALYHNVRYYIELNERL